MKKYPLIILFLLLNNPICINATHIVGGVLNYECLGNDSYRITLKLYRDCGSAGNAAFDDPIYVAIYNSANDLIDNIAIPFPGSVKLPPLINNPCFTPSEDICVEEAVYIAIVDSLPPVVGGYCLSYQRCCRNYSVLNIANYGVGATFTAQIPGSEITNACNSNPAFKEFPPIFLCAGLPLEFDHSAIDADGDSLVYELCDPYTGGTALFPKPNPASPPPYNYVNWTPPYNGGYQMSSDPPIAINSSTGLLTCTPDKIGQWVIGVCVNEYRDGILISTTKRDFQFNVINCPGVIGAAIMSQDLFCKGFKVDFKNSSYNANSFLWDFGVTGVTDDTSTQVTPTFTFPESGIYTVRLIANPGSICADTTFSTFEIYPLLKADIISDKVLCYEGHNMNFSAGGSFQDYAEFLWSFGPDANILNSTDSMVSNIVFNSPGFHAITLTIKENGCSSLKTDSIELQANPVSNLNIEISKGCMPLTVKFNNSSTAATLLVYRWNFGDGNESVEESPEHTYINPGNYSISLSAITTTGCIDTSYVYIPDLITVHPLPTADFSVEPLEAAIYEPDFTFTDQSLNIVKCIYYFGDGNTSQERVTKYTYSDTGIYYITQIVYSEFECADTAFGVIRVNSDHQFFVPNAFTPDGDNINDVFKPLILGVKEYKMEIFDRWGELIFTTKDTEIGWNGRVKNNEKNAKQDVYIYMITFNNLNEKQFSFSGSVTLLR